MRAVAGAGLEATDGVTAREERSRWVPAGPLEALLALGAIVLLGATAFGAWHVVVGGLVNGNPRAAAFGAGLMLAAGVPLVVGIVIVRRHRRGGR
jgi:hypothetical protein